MNKASVLNDQIHSCHDSFKCDVTLSHVWHDWFRCVTWLIHICNMTHPCTVEHERLGIYVTWRIQVWRDSFMCVTRLTLYVTWLIGCGVTHFMRDTTRIICDMTDWKSNVWCDLCSIFSSICREAFSVLCVREHPETRLLNVMGTLDFQSVMSHIIRVVSRIKWVTPRLMLCVPWLILYVTWLIMCAVT